MIRCPHCGQAESFLAKLDGYVLPLAVRTILPMFNESKQSESITKIQLPDTSWVDFRPELVKRLETFGTLTCVACGTTHNVGQFFDAFDYPEDYELEENLCYCGEELYMENIPGTQTMRFTCDKCGWIKPKIDIFCG